MRLFLVSLLFVSTTYAVTCAIFGEILYGDRNKLMEKSARIHEMLQDHGTEQCRSCSKTFGWIKDEQDNFGFYVGGCKEEEKSECKMLSVNTKIQQFECSCSSEMCNREGDLLREWNKIFGPKVGNGELRNSVEPPAGMLKCYMSLNIVMRDMPPMEETEDMKQIRERSKNPAEISCFDSDKCSIEVEVQGSKKDMTSYMMDCAKQKGKSDGCEISADKMKATCYCSSNLCFTPADGHAMMEELAQSGTVSLNRGGGNSYPGGGIPGAGGAAVYSNGSPATFMGPLLFVAVVFLAV